MYLIRPISTLLSIHLKKKHSMKSFLYLIDRWAIAKRSLVAVWKLREHFYSWRDRYDCMSQIRQDWYHYSIPKINRIERIYDLFKKKKKKKTFFIFRSTRWSSTYIWLNTQFFRVRIEMIEIRLSLMSFLSQSFYSPKIVESADQIRPDWHYLQRLHRCSCYYCYPMNWSVGWD